jgi:CRISPR-associated endonuclease/helicase Cas3
VPTDVVSAEGFAGPFEALTGNVPFPWQEALFERLVADDFPSRCDIPTGLGKTSVLAIWLLALAKRAELGTAHGFPRRLVYVVNRRTVVDQATREAERFCEPERLNDPRLAATWARLCGLRIQDIRDLERLEEPVAVSTLRGQFADNGAWCIDPSRAAVIVGTVDMIGSRLLFSGYGRGFKTKPLHAGFLGQGALLVHDEAHLEPAFQELLLAIEKEQASAESSERDRFGRFTVMALTATSRVAGASDRGVLRLSDKDRAHEIVSRRVNATKRMVPHPVDDKKLVDRAVDLALAHQDSGKAILVFLWKVDDVQKVTKKLPRDSWIQLTGTLRGLERDELTRQPIFARFDRKSTTPPQLGTVYLVCTSAGEVGVDFSADHLVCDLTPFDSMAQRFGRLNRFGDGDARIDVVHLATLGEAAVETEPTWERARARTLALLSKLPRDERGHDASPAALGALDEAERTAAFTPLPEILQATDVLFDAWALTSIREPMPGRPPVADWLHGVPSKWEPPRIAVAWRREVELGLEQQGFSPQALLAAYPLKPHEILRDTAKRVLGELKTIAEAHPELTAWLVFADGRVELTRLDTLVDRKDDDAALRDATIVLPPSAGGLEKAGALRGGEPAREDLDVADKWWANRERTIPRRIRLSVGPEGQSSEGRERHRMQLVLSIPLAPPADAGDDAEEGSEPSTWRWYVDPGSSEEQGSRTALRQQRLDFHLGEAEHFAREIARALGLSATEANAIRWAARFHDLGKDRRLWQRSIGNFDAELVLAKSGDRRAGRASTKYRHELGSLFDMELEADFRRLSDDEKELARHVVATHHGRARPCFLDGELFDPDHSDAACAALARDVTRRFARLQRKYGRWGLAYLESLVRAADVLASIAIDPSANASAQSEAAP